MSIIFSSIGPVKPVSNRRFGAGLLAFVPPSRPVNHTASDESNYAQLLADESAARAEAAREFDRAIEDRYISSYQIDRVTRGPLL